MTEYKVNAIGTAHYLRVEVGPVNESGNFLFGETAEVSRSTGLYGDEGFEPAEVSFAAIGSHDVETARRRLRSYEIAIWIAEELNTGNLRDENLEIAADVLNGQRLEFDDTGTLVHKS